MDADAYAERARAQWDRVADGWHRWIKTFAGMLDQATEQMLDLAGVAEGIHVLDVAAGDGEQSLRAARRVGARGRVLATDLSPGILKHAEAAAADEGLEHMHCRVMDATRLELEDASFDAAISRLGLMLIPEPTRALSELRRVLRPGARLAAMVFTTPEKSPWLSRSAMAALKAANKPPPQPGEPGLFALGSPGVFEGRLRDVGFREVSSQSVSTTLEMESASACARMIRDIGGRYHEILADLDEHATERAWEEIEASLRSLESGEGFRSPCEVLIARGVA